LGISGQQDVGNESGQDDLPGSLLAHGFIDQVDESEGERIDEDGRWNNQTSDLDRFRGCYVGDQLTGDVEADQDCIHFAGINPLNAEEE